MKKCTITVVRKSYYGDLVEKYGNPAVQSCEMQEGEVYITNGWEKPQGMCESAWRTMSDYVMALSYGAEDIYDGWMKDKKSVMISCSDGFSPVSFLIEATDEDVD